MRNPNSYGGVIKLSGKRRKPYAARITTGWTDEGKQIMKYLGYYETKKEAMMALADYNQNPYSLSQDITFEELYDKWSEEHFPKVSESNCKGYRASYKACEQLHSMKVTDIRLIHLQSIIDDSEKNQPTLKKMKILWGLMYDYAVKYELIPPDRREIIRYVDLSKKGNPNKYDRTAFSDKEIKTLWKNSGIDSVKVILILIYSGLRIGELLDLKREDVDLEQKVIHIVKSKTEAGIRQVPIADKIFAFIEEFYNDNGEYLITMKNKQKKFQYRNFKDAYWNPVLTSMNMEHKPHDARHTFISLMAAAEIDERIIKAIVGHAGSGVTEIVYTHIPMRKMLEAVNKI